MLAGIRHHPGARRVVTDIIRDGTSGLVLAGNGPVPVGEYGTEPQRKARVHRPDQADSTDRWTWLLIGA